MTGGWGIEPLTDKDGEPIAGRPLRVRDYVLLSDPHGEIYEVQLAEGTLIEDGIVGFHCRVICGED